jgi:hypothetical protein
MEGTGVEDCMLLQVDKEADMVADSTVNLSTYSAPIRVNSKFTSHMTLRDTWVQLQWTRDTKLPASPQLVQWQSEKKPQIIWRKY